MSVEQKIHPQMTIEEILSKFPHKAQKLAHEMTRAGLHCVGCQAATWETLEMGMRGHGMSDEALQKMVRQLNTIIEEETDRNTITLTPKAAKKYLEILDQEGKQGWGIRFSEKMAGCNGFEYELDYSEKALPDDVTFVSQGIEIHVSKNLMKRLIGSQIDYRDGLQDSGFDVTNPNVRSACGCGTSHNYGSS